MSILQTKNNNAIIHEIAVNILLNINSRRHPAIISLPSPPPGPTIQPSLPHVTAALLYTPPPHTGETKHQSPQGSLPYLSLTKHFPTNRGRSLPSQSATSLLWYFFPLQWVLYGRWNFPPFMRKKISSLESFVLTEKPFHWPSLHLSCQYHTLSLVSNQQ